MARMMMTTICWQYLGAWRTCDCLSQRGKEILKKLAIFLPSSIPIARMCRNPKPVASVMEMRPAI